MWYIKYYKCSDCGCEWQDEWDCLCDDKCPNCNTSMSPYNHDVIEDDWEEEYESANLS